MAGAPSGCSRPPTGISTEQRRRAGPASSAQSSVYPRVSARLWKRGRLQAKSERQSTILGNNLTYAFSVGFNGTQAAFRVVSSSEIVATVPAGATAGTVEVGIPNVTLSSNVPFQVQ
jgi:hypothetical protein